MSNMENNMATDTSASGFFNKNASASYDERQQRMAPIIDNLHFLIGIVLQHLPTDAHILCVGVGTGAEIIRLAKAHPDWRFTGIDPSMDMLDVCRDQLEKQGILPRVTLFHGYLADFAGTQQYDAVLCLLVTQFVKDPGERQHMVDAIAERLKPKGYLINAEISDDLSSPRFHDLLEKWKTLQRVAGSSHEQVAGILSGWQKHISVLPPAAIENFLRNSGLAMPVQFFQSLLIHAWYSQKD